MLRARLLLVVGALVPAVHAQVPQPSTAPAPHTSHVVRGIVFDSVARAPLPGAVVQLVLLDTARERAPASAAPHVFAVTADSRGRYSIPGLPSGRFAIGFQHDALNALGLESPLRAFELANDTSVTVDLAIPDGPAVRAQLCGAATRLASEGVLVGYIADARGEHMLPGAVLRARWLELSLARGDYRAVHRTVTAIVGEDGRYVACGLTSDEAVAIEITMPGRHAIVSRMAVPAGGAMRQDFRLADSGVVKGTSSLGGKVMLADGTVLPAGRAEIAALALVVPVVNGEFSMSGIPAGSWMVEARAIGFEPRSAMVDFSDGGVASTSLTLGERAQVLDAVSVIGKPGGDTKILSAIASRRTVSVGSVFLPGNEWLESSYDPADVLRSSPGFRYVNPDVLLSSGCGYKYPPSSDEPTSMNSPMKVRGRTLAVYLNGLRVVGGLAELRTSVTMKNVLAIEAYQDVFTAPIEWRTNDACAVMAVWTKR